MNTFRRLLQLMAPFCWWIALAVLLSLATVGSSVGLMAMSAYLISKAAISTDQTELALAITGVRFFALSRAVFRYLERLISHTASFRILTELRTWFYRAVEPLAPARLQTIHSGDLLARIMSDIKTLENLYSRALIPPLSAVLVTFFASLLLGSFDARLGWALLLFLILTGFVLPLVTRRISRSPSAEQVAVRAQLTAVAVDSIQGISDLLAFGQEIAYRERLLSISHQFERQQQKLAQIRGLNNALVALVTSLAGLTILLLAIPLVTAGEIDGVFLALLPLTAIAAFEAVQPLASSMQQWESSQVAGSRIFELIDAPAAITDPVQPRSLPTTYDLEIRDLHFSYEPHLPPVLCGLNLTLESGRRLLITGSSGSGKTTLVNLLLRFWDYDQGRIAIGGHDLHNYSAQEVRQLIAVAEQHTHLFNSTIGDNLYLANPDATDEELAAACHLVQMDEFIGRLPQGLDTLIGENGLLLSGGERQRIAIARAILKNAPILILDEATANIDALTTRRIWEGLEGHMVGRTTIIISHTQSNLPRVDHVLNL